MLCYTKAASMYFRAKEQTSLPRFTSRFPSIVGHPLILLYLELFQACLEYFNLVLQFKYVLLQGWYLICLVLNGCQQIWNTQWCIGLYFLDYRLECVQTVFDVHKCGGHLRYGITLFEDSIHQWMNKKGLTVIDGATLLWVVADLLISNIC